MFEFLKEEKPCPFCGYHKLLLVKEKDYDTNIPDLAEKCKQATVWFHVVCMKCKARSREESNKERAIAAWNTRNEAQKGREG